MSSDNHYQLSTTVKKMSRLHPQLPTQLTRPVLSAGDLVVKLNEDIDADDYSQHPATVQELVDGEWTDTAVIVQVRKPLEEPVSEGVRYIARQVSDLGLCIKQTVTTIFDYVNVKAFSVDDGAWQWESKALRVMLSHNGTVRLYRQRDVSGWTNSTIVDFGVGAGLGIVPLRPNATANNQWTTRNAANIDDAISAPAGTGDGAICQAIGPTDNNKEQQWTVSGTYTAGSNRIAAVSIWILAKKTEDTQPASISAVKFRTNGTWYAAASVPNLTTSYAWHRVDIENPTTTAWTLSTSSPAVAITAVVPDASASIEVEAVYIDALCILGSGGFAYPTGTAPTGRYKQYAVDCVTVASDGTETVNVSDCELFEVLKAPGDSRTTRGLPTTVPSRLAVPAFNTPHLRATSCSDAGVVIDNVVPQLQIFDPWKRSTTKKYRLCLGWYDNAGSALQLVFRRFATSATLTHEDDASTIETALSAIDGVVSVTVTGGPLFVKHVDLEIQWEESTDQFHSVHLLNKATSSPAPWAIINVDTYEVIGYSAFVVVENGWNWASDGSEDIVITTRANIGPTPWLFATRIAQETDANGWITYSTDIVWSSKITTVTIEQANGYLGKNVVSFVMKGCVFGVHNQRNFASSGDQFNYWVLNESDGSGLPGGTPFDFYGGGTGRTSHTTVTTFYVADNDKHVFYGEQPGMYWPLLWEMPATPNELSPDRSLLLGTTPLKNDADFLWTARSAHGNTPVLLDLQLANRYDIQTVLESGGDGFFPTHTYNRRTQMFQGTGARYRGSSLEFRFSLGQLAGSTWVSSDTSDWLAYDASDSEVEAALNAMRGNTSAATPSITVAFPALTADAEDLAWFYRGASVVLCMQRSGVATDITDDNLIEFGASLRIEIRNANVERFLQISKENFDDGVVQWQRDVGLPALTTTLAQALYADSGSQILAYNGWWKPLSLEEGSGLPVDDLVVYGTLP